MPDETSKQISRERLIELLASTDDLKLTVAKPDATQTSGDEPLVLTRADLERLIETDENIAFNSYHSSGISNAGNHSSN
jgi:hypothetical protein